MAKVELPDQRQGRRGPEQVEGGKHQRLVEGAHAHDAVLAQLGEGRGERLAIAHAPARAPLRAGKQQRDADQRHGGRRHQEGGAPAEGAREEIGDGASEHDAEEQAAHHRADHAPLLFRRGQMRGERDEHLRAGRADAGQDRGDQKAGRALRRGDGEAADHRHQDGAQHDTPVFEQVGHRHDEEEPEAVAKLRQRRDQPRDAGRHADFRPDDIDQRLRIIEIGDDHPARHRHQQDDRTAKVGAGGKGRGGHAGLMGSQPQPFNRRRGKNCALQQHGVRATAVPAAAAPARG